MHPLPPFVFKLLNYFPNTLHKAINDKRLLQSPVSCLLSPSDCGTKDTARQCGNFDVSAADETLENFVPASHRLAAIVVVTVVVATVVVATVASIRP